MTYLTQNPYDANSAQAKPVGIGSLKLIKPQPVAANDASDAVADQSVATPDEQPASAAPQALTAEPSDDAFTFWNRFGFNVVSVDQDTGRPVTTDERALDPRSKLQTNIPANVIAFGAASDMNSTLMRHLRSLGATPFIVPGRHGDETVFYRLEQGVDILSIKANLPSGVMLYTAGDVVELPSGDTFTPERYRASTLDELDELSGQSVEIEAGSVPDDAASVATHAVDPLVVGNPLQRYSLLGFAGELEAEAKETTPLLGNVVLAGQATIIYAPPGSGKTLLTIWLLMAAITAGRVLGGNVYYMNADDGSAGVAAKARLLEELGAHILVPGHRGFAAAKLVDLLREMVRNDKCRGVVIVVDTLKKAVDTMDKRDSATFGQAVRECVAHGATFIGLGHTRKNASSNGKLVHGGTSDLVEDADAVCILTPLDIRSGDGEKVAQFMFSKRRGDNLDEAYAFAAGGTRSYDELIASVRLVDPDNLDRFKAEEEERSDQPIIDAVIACIGEGITQKMVLADAVSRRARCSTRAAIQVIERYQGDDPAAHRWTYTVQQRGAKVYSLLNA